MACLLCAECLPEHLRGSRLLCVKRWCVYRVEEGKVVILAMTQRVVPKLVPNGPSIIGTVKRRE